MIEPVILFLALSMAVGVATTLISRNSQSLIFSIGLALVSYILLRDTLLEIVQISLKMALFVMASCVMALISALSVGLLDGMSHRYVQGAATLARGNATRISILWTIAAAALYPLMVYAADAFGASWDEAAQSTGERPILRIAFLIAYYSSILRIRMNLQREGFRIRILLEILVIFVITVLLRDKIYAIFLLLALTFGVVKLEPARLLLISALGVLLYFSVTFVRYLGAADEIDIEKIMYTASIVSDLRIEHGLSGDFYSVFSYYNENSPLHGDSYLRLFALPVTYLLGYDLFPNPIYKYHAIAGDPQVASILAGSAHPTIFGDSYANFGALGIYVPAAWIIALSVLDAISRKSALMSQSVMMGTLFMVPLVVRGTIYNALLSFSLIIAAGAINVGLVQAFGGRGIILDAK